MARLSSEQELELWDQWKKSGDEEVFGQLMDSFEPMRESYLSKSIPASPLPKTVLQAEMFRIHAEGIEKFDPNKGVALGTYVYSRQPKIHRTIEKFGNIGRIPIAKQQKIGSFQRAKLELNETYGREPTSYEMSQHLGWPKKEIELLEKGITKDLVGSQMEFETPLIKSTSSPIMLDMIEKSIKSPEEELVFQHIYGRAGKKQTDRVSDISNMTGIPQGKIYQIKNKLAEKALKYRGYRFGESEY